MPTSWWTASRPHLMRKGSPRRSAQLPSHRRKTRRRATLHADRRGKVTLGFAEARSHEVVDIAECHVLAPALFALVAPLRTLLRQLEMGRRADVHLTLADQGADILVTKVAAEGLAAADAIVAFCQTYGVARFAVDDGMGAETRWEPEPVTINLGGLPVPLPHAAFLQATIEGESVLVDAVREGGWAPRSHRRPVRRARHLRAGVARQNLRRGGRARRGFCAQGCRPPRPAPRLRRTTATSTGGR